jgi:hypothetical protein
MKVAVKVVKKTVGMTMRSATTTMKTVKSTAARTPMRRAVMREKRKTVTENVMKSKRGKPVKTIWMVRKACMCRSVLYFEIVEE